MIACPCQRNVRLHQASKGLGQSNAGRIQNREMIKAGCALWQRRPVSALPSVESDMMMITARGNKGRFVAVSLCQLKSENAAVKIECPLQISHLQMHMPDAHPRINWCLAHTFTLTNFAIYLSPKVVIWHLSLDGWLITVHESLFTSDLGGEGFEPPTYWV